jgi:hypothetical protein
VERRSTKHSPRLDDDLKRETQALARGAPAESRVEEHREHEPAGDRDPMVSACTTEGPGPDVRTARRQLSRHLRRSAFPADRSALLAEARENDAPEPVLEAVSRLPRETTFATVYEVWDALARPAQA